MKKKRGLNRGLDVLLGDIESFRRTQEETSNADMQSTPSGHTVEMIAVERLHPDSVQPRRRFDETAIDALANSIRTQGILQPILVRKSDTGFSIIAGERRWRAAQKAGHTEVPCLLYAIGDAEAAIVALVENMQRRDLNPIERATGFQRLMDEHRFTHQKIAETIGVSRAAITNTLRLLALDDVVKTALSEGSIDMGHARALLPLDAEKQRSMTEQIIAQGLSARAVERLVQKTRMGHDTGRKAAEASPDIRALEQRLSLALQTRVRLRHHKSGKGSIEIFYQNLDVFDGLVQKIS